MPKSSTTISKDNRAGMPPRGRSKKTLILEAMREQAELGLKNDATQDDCEKAWFGILLKNALDPECGDSGLCLRLITERGWSALKPSSDLVKFDFDADATPAQQAAQVLKAVSDGVIPVDHGNQFVAAISSMINIEEGTELKAEIARIKEKLKIG